MLLIAPVPKDDAVSLPGDPLMDMFEKGGVVMKIFKPVLMFESRRFLCKRNSILLIILIVLSLGFLQYGIFEYKDILKRKEKFQEIEKIKVSKFVNYRQYGTYGFRMLFVPSTISIFYINSGVIPDMTAYVDSGVRLKIYMPYKGKNIFKIIRSNFTDFSGIILFFGTLLSILYGYDTFRGKEYLKFISSISSGRKVFFSMVLSRVLLLFLTFLAIISCGLMMALMNGLFIPVDKFLGYFILLILMVSLFFFLLGTVFSSIKSLTTAITFILSCWFVLIYFIPTTVNIFISSRADLITPIYELELDKFKIVMDFEKRSIEIAGNFGKKVSENDRKLCLSYLNNELKQIKSLEEKMRNQMKNNISIYHGISMFFPTTYYISGNIENSSMGYESLDAFYKYVQKLKWRFVKFYVRKIFFSNFSTVIPFVKDEEIVFYAKPSLTVPFWGLFINILYSIVLLLFSYYRIDKSLLTIENLDNDITDMQDLKLKSGEFKVFHVEGDLFNNQLFCLMSGKTKKIKKMNHKYKGKFFIDDMDMSETNSKRNLLYLCRTDHIPGEIKVQHFFDLITTMMNLTKNDKENIADRFNITPFKHKRFKKLKKHEAEQMMLAILSMKKYSVYVINDAARGMSIDFAIQLKEKMESLKQAGALVIFLTTDDILMMRSDKPDIYFYETNAWCRVVDDYKRGKTIRT